MRTPNSVKKWKITLARYLTRMEAVSLRLTVISIYHTDVTNPRFFLVLLIPSTSSLLTMVPEVACIGHLHRDEYE